MQSSLLRFVQRQEKKRKRSTSEDTQDNGNERKKRKGMAECSGKLKQFNRPSSVSTEVEITGETVQEPDTSDQIKSKVDTPAVTQATSSTNVATLSTPLSPPDLSAEVVECQAGVLVVKAKTQGLTTSKKISKSKTETNPRIRSKSTTLCKQYTPLERQYITIKAQYPDAVLFVECGYKYRFLGEDAEMASKILNIGCFEDHNFYTASIPVHRLHIHLRRLVAAGCKVGVVKQTETAALKAASDKKSGLFSRELTALYTRTTLLGPDVNPPSGRGRGGGDKGEGEGGVSLGEMEEEEEGLWLMCVCEEAVTVKEKRPSNITIGFLAVQPAVGNMIYDQFSDSVLSLSELQLRLSHLQPAEILYPCSCSGVLEEALLNWKRFGGQSGVRTEKLTDEWFNYDSAFSTVAEFYSAESNTHAVTTPSTTPTTPTSSTTETACTTGPSSSSSITTTTDSQSCINQDNNHTKHTTEALQKAINLPKCPLSCLSALIHHLKVFKLQRVLKLTSNMELFSVGDHCMRLNSKTLENLEVFQNMEDKREKNTLFWILNHTRTPFGRRLLHRWTAYPLVKVAEVQKRQTAVSELSSSESLCVSLLKKTVYKLPDLEKMLCSAYHKKCSPADFLVLLHHLNEICGKMESCSEMVLTDLHSKLLRCIVKEIPRLLQDCKHFLAALKESSARKGCYEDLFTDVDSYPAVLAEKRCIAEVKQRLNEHKNRFRKTLAYPNAEYTTVSGVQYLVEVKNKDVNKVPSDWTRISGTKQVTRFHPPYVLEDVQLLAQHSDQLVASAKQAWNEFLGDFSVHYGACKKAVDLLATLDCLLSLADVAVMPGYICPTMVEGAVVEIDGGRHPVIDLLLADGEQYVANNTSMSNTGMRAMIITGPNMGGKSSYIKQVALICIMAQIGSFVPAKSATLGMLDAVYTRMGASDRIFAGKSTFMVELMEASEIMQLATSRSLVILDELGRGTSTHDGVAVAYATLTYFIEDVRALTMFVTHYPLLAEMESTHPGTVGNFHMSYVEAETTSEGYEKIVFLYQLEQGQARKSYGLNVAALAGLDSAILRVASDKSQELEKQCSGRRTLAQSQRHLKEEAIFSRKSREEAAKTIVTLSLILQQKQQDSYVDMEAVIHIAKKVL